MRKTLPIFYNALLLTAVNLILRFVSTSFQVHISARIGAEGVGLLQLVMSVGGLALTAGIAGIRTATMYLTAEELGRKQPQNVTWVLKGCLLYSILCSCAISFTVYYAAPFLAANWIGNIHTVGAIRLYSIFLPVVCMTGCMTGYFTAANRITTLAGIEIAEQLCYMAVTMAVLTLWAGNNAERACSAIVFGSGISSVITLTWLLLLRHKEKSQKGVRIPVARRLYETALPLAIADDVKAGISTAENLIVPRRLALFPGETAPLATFGIVVGMVFPVLMFPAAILFALAELLIPELARCNAAASTVRIQYLVRRALRVALLYGCMCGGILFLSAEPLCTSLYKNPGAGKYLMLYSCLAPMLYCDAIADAMTKGLGQQKANVRYNILTSAMDVAFLFILLPKFGMTGYFVSFLVTHLVNFILSLRRLSKVSGVRFPLYTPMLTCSAALFAAATAVKLPATASKITAFILLYAALLMIFRVISIRDVLWIKSLLKRK